MGSQKLMEGKTTNTYSLRKKIEKPKLLKAKDMFEKLGYELKYDKMRDTYTYISSYHNTIIEFDNIIRTVRISEIYREYAQTFNINELKAINQQVKELHWND